MGNLCLVKTWPKGIRGVASMSFRWGPAKFDLQAGSPSFWPVFGKLWDTTLPLLNGAVTTTSGGHSPPGYWLVVVL